MSYVSDNRAWLEPYFRQLIEAMNLGYWRITLEDQWPAHGDADTSDASCWHSSDYYRAKVYLNDPDGDVHPESLAHAAGDSMEAGVTAELLTAPDFGCVQHEPREDV